MLRKDLYGFFLWFSLHLLQQTNPSPILLVRALLSTKSTTRLLSSPTRPVGGIWEENQDKMLITSRILHKTHTMPPYHLHSLHISFSSSLHSTWLSTYFSLSLSPSPEVVAGVILKILTLSSPHNSAGKANQAVMQFLCTNLKLQHKKHKARSASHHPSAT